MTTYEIIVTDVTCYGTLYCVAGWDRLAGGLIRPEPSDANTTYEASRFWGMQYAGPGNLFSVGNIVRFEATPAPPNFPFPHASEDRLIVPGRPSSILGQLSIPQVAQAVAAGIAPSLQAAFGGALVRAASAKAYVPAGHAGPSLGALMIASDQLTFYEDAYTPSRPKLRAIINHGGVNYDLSVPADAARTRWKVGGVAGLAADLRASHRIHLRVGLSRPFAAMPNQCYAQVNGIYFL